MSRRTADTPADPVEDYLDRLLVTLSGSPRQVRHTLAEALLVLDQEDGFAVPPAGPRPRESARGWRARRSPGPCRPVDKF